jgi:hypothetical protein
MEEGLIAPRKKPDDMMVPISGRDSIGDDCGENLGRHIRIRLQGNERGQANHGYSTEMSLYCHKAEIFHTSRLVLSSP